MNMKYCPCCATPLQERLDGSLIRLACADNSCGYMFFNNPTPVVAAIVEHEGNIVLARNIAWPEGMFALISGFLEKGETPESGIVREVEEELNLKSIQCDFIGNYSFHEQNQLIICFYIKAVGELVIDTSELAEIKLVKPDELKGWPIGTGLAVEDWIASRQ